MPNPSPDHEEERRQAQEDLRYQAQLLATVGEAIIATSLTGLIHYVNPATEALFGWTLAEVKGKHISTVTSSGVTQEQGMEIMKRLQRGESWSGEFLLTRKDGTQFLGQVTNWPICNTAGKLVGVNGIVQDITQRRSLEAQLRQAQKLEVIGRLAGGVAHDFNNILQAMLLNVQLLQLQPGLSAESQQSVTELHLLTERAAAVTAQLLLFARRQSVQLQSLELNDAVTRALALLKRLLGARVTIRCESTSSPIWVAVDASMLDQVIMNLCLNARDAMPGGGVLTLSCARVELDQQARSLHPDARPGHYGCLSVRDTGCGMSAALQEHIFEPFFTTKEVSKGTGLGLAAVYGIIQQHRGFLRVESREGIGSTFQIYLPVASPVSAEEASADGAVASQIPMSLVEQGLSFRFAVPDDLTGLAQLVNSAYRGDSSRAGWTTEADLLSGVRTDVAELSQIINTEGSVLLLCIRSGEIIGSVHLQRIDEESAHLGMFVVRPVLQGGGVGKRLLREAESTVQRLWGCHRIAMSVLTARPELIAYYQRRGYLRTGKTQPFSTADGKNRILVESLELETLEKIVPKQTGGEGRPS
jgi:PAS domain S-box-containing protein